MAESSNTKDEYEQRGKDRFSEQREMELIAPTNV